jgi:hypothetical protein
MLYSLFDYLDRVLDIPGTGVFRYISFRAGMAALVSLVITITFGHHIINWIRNRQIGETVRDLGLEGQTQKKGTPTMGGLMMIAAILIPTLLFANLNNIYIILLLITTVWLGLIGFLDDYIKVFRKNKDGLKGRFKIVGQIGIGVIVGATLYYNDDVVIREFSTPVSVESGVVETPSFQDTKALKTTIPFFKNNEIDGLVRKARRDGQHLREALQAVDQNRTYQSPDSKKFIQEQNSHEFTQFDLHIIKLLYEGVSQKEMPEYLQQRDIRPSSLSSIEKRLNLMKDVLGFIKNEQLVAHCKELGFI